MATMHAPPHYLSNHSSNPLQVPSDDPLNSLYFERVRPSLQREKFGHVRGASNSSLGSATPRARANVLSLHNSSPIPLEANDDDDELLLVETQDDEVVPETDQRPSFDDMEERGANDEIDFGDEYEAIEEVTGYVPLDQDDLSPDVDQDEEFRDDESEDNEEHTLELKSKEDRLEIEEEMKDLENTVSSLKEDYKLLDRLGEGTFSSVYKALDLHHTIYHNIPWRGYHPPSSSAYYQSAPLPNKFYVALKRIYVTSSPARILNEISILQDCRGCRHVSQLITAFRRSDQVVAVMPYVRNEDFRTFYQSLPLSGIQSYFRCLFKALRDIHARQIVHRDVKPANFLFDPRKGCGTLCDFGLAQRVDLDVQTRCYHTSASKLHPHGEPKRVDAAEALRVKSLVLESRKKAAGPPERVGIPSDDSRPQVKANRAGTRGFRAPEVLLKCEDQTVSIDIWAAGTILLSFLACKFPIFTASDDVEALMELAAVFGKRKMEKCAQLHNRSFCTNVPSVEYGEVPWPELVERINPYLYQRASVPTPTSTSHSPSSPTPRSPPPPTKHNILLSSALDLLTKCLDWDATRRITAREALFHPFLAEGTEVRLDPLTGEDYSGDDLFFPHPIGEGVCRRGHWTEGDAHFVRLEGKKYHELMPGEGIAIGLDSCEFHTDGTWLQPGGDEL